MLGQYVGPYLISHLGSIKLQEKNLLVYEEHKIEREAQDPNRTERDGDDNVPARRAVFFFFKTFNVKRDA